MPFLSVFESECNSRTGVGTWLLDYYDFVVQQFATTLWGFSQCLIQKFVLCFVDRRKQILHFDPEQNTQNEKCFF